MAEREAGRKREYILIVIGAVLLAVSVNLVYEPMDLVTGGVTGLAIIVKYVSETFFSVSIPIWLTNIICNIPLFAAAIYMKGKKFITKTLFATIVFSIALYLVPCNGFTEGDMILAAVCGGVLGGTGIGLVIHAHASTGGTDLLGIILHHRIRHITIAQLIFFIDGIIIVLGALTFGIHKSLYAIIAIFITSKVMDSILEGVKFAKLVYIISDWHEEVAEAIFHSMDRGITGLHATGMYSNKEKKMLLCVVSKKEIVDLMDIVGKKDSAAFVIVSDVREVLGEGFIEYKQ